MRRFLFLLLISLFLILADEKGWLNLPKSFIQRPLVWAQQEIFAVFQKTKSTPPDFEEKLRQLAVSQNDLNACREENEKMRRLLGAPLPPKWKFLDARVLGLVSGRMRINKGRAEGVADGANVVAENVLVGRVVFLGEHNSWLQLPLSPNSKIPVVVKKVGSSGIQARGLLIGQGEALILDRVLQSEDIQKGDLVVTSGEADWLSELLIGTIEEVLPKTAAVYQKAKVEPLLGYDNLRIVFVVR